MTRTPPTKVMVGLSGAGDDSWLQTTIMRGYGIPGLVKLVTSAMANNDVRGGLHLHVPDLDMKTPPLAFSSLIRLLRKSLHSRGQILLVTLPGDVKLHSTLITKDAMRSGAFFVTMTHFVPPPDQSGTVVCSTTSNPSSVLDGRTNSLESWNDYFGRVQSGHTLFRYPTNAVQKMLFTFDIACFEYQVEHHGKLTFHRRRQCPYSRFCRAVLDRSQMWKIYVDPTTRCRVALSGAKALTVSNPKVVTEMKSNFTTVFARLVLFNYHLDDVGGACGSRSGLTKEVMCVVMGLTDQACSRLP